MGEGLSDKQNAERRLGSQGGERNESGERCTMAQVPSGGLHRQRLISSPHTPLEDEDTEARREQLNSPTKQVLPAASLQREEVSAQRGKVTCPRSHSNRWQKWAPLAV